MTWTCFRDSGYYDKWAIQHQDRCYFNQAIHINTKEEAEFLVDELNELERLREESSLWEWGQLSELILGCKNGTLKQMSDEIKRLRAERTGD